MNLIKLNIFLRLTLAESLNHRFFDDLPTHLRHEDDQKCHEKNYYKHS